MGNGNIRRISAPVNERREWLFLLVRVGGHQVLRYDLFNKMFFSPAGDQFALVYVDSVYLFKGRKLTQMLPALLDRHVHSIDEYDGSRHLPYHGDGCIVTSIQSFARNIPQAQQVIEDLQLSKKR